MLRPFPNEWILKANEWDLALCEALNHWGQFKYVRSTFGLFSRLGDGAFWYGLILALPLIYGWYGFWVALLSFFSGSLCMSAYKAIKKHYGRERPFVTWKSITPYIVPLDRYSFPSGHTMNALHCALLVGYFLPGLTPLLMVMVSGIALSRVILGMHYPSDVILGGLFGTFLAITTLGMLYSLSHISQ